MHDDAIDDDAQDSSIKHNTSSTQSPNKFLDLLRAFRFQLAASILRPCMRGRWNANTERRKVAIYRNHAVASVFTFLHIAPLTAYLTLLIVQWSNYWVGGYEDYSSNLQFVAKVHELLMQASIVEVLLSLIRARVVDGLLPLGMLSGAMQPTQLSYLWSLDFLSIFQTRAVQGWQRIVFIVAVPFLFAMTALVGPSSAILMIPRASSPRVLSDEMLYTTGSTTTIYPTRNLSAWRYGDIKGLTAIMDSSYPYQNHIDKDGTRWDAQVTSGSDHRIGALTRRVVRVSSREASTRDSSGIVSELSEAKATIATGVISSDFIDTTLTKPGRNVTTSVVAASPVVDVRCWGPFNKTKIAADARIVTIFPKTLTPNTGKPGLATSDGQAREIAMACNISAYWNDVEVQSKNNGFNTLVDAGWPSTIERPGVRSIDLDFTYGHALRNATSDFLSARLLAAILVMWIANVPMSELSKSTSDQFKWGVLAEEIPTTDYTPYRFISRELGFGYGTRSTSIHLSMAVMLAYCIIVFCYIIYTLITGSVSTAWTSGVEIVALALQSKRPDHLGHAGVGLDSIKTLGESVGIRVNADNEIELVFAHDRDFETRGLRKLERNMAY